MRKFKKYISIFIALQLVCATLAPVYADVDKMKFSDEMPIYDSAEIGNNEIQLKGEDRLIIKFKDDKKKEKFRKSRDKKIKNKVKEEKELKVKNKHYSIITINEDENVDELIQSINEEYGDEIELVQPDYIINSFSNEESENTEDVSMVGQITSKNENIDIIENNDEEVVEESAEEVVDETMAEVVADAVEETTAEAAEESVEEFVEETALEVVEDVVEEAMEGNMEEILVAVIDTAIDYNHDALMDSIYVNSEELSDGVDNDENGYIDDIIGWDFVNDMDISQSKLTSNHGTHVAGLIVADNIGVGTNAKILPLNVFNDGIAYTSDIIAAIEYAEQAGAKIVNCSWGSTANNPALEEAITNSNMLFVCAVGNRGININETPVYPASYDLDNIISVGACNDRDYLAYFSDYGYDVDIVANGYKVHSTFVNNNYGSMMGTSMSAAYVSGVAALVYNGSAIDTKNHILDTGDKVSNLLDKINNGCRVNYENAVTGIVSDEIVENTNINYNEERYQQIVENAEGYELFDLDPEPSQIYAGQNHSLIVDNWGLVRVYGDNEYNQVGNVDASEIYPYDGTVEGLENVEKVSTFFNHNLALISGTVYAWGQNDSYQLGHTNGESNATPMQVEFFNSDGTSPIIVDIEAGGLFSLALDSNGNVWAWGNNKYGQLANGSAGYYSATPKIVLSGVSKISAGKYHALAVKDNVVYGWGRSADEEGTLGENSEYSQATPIQISGLEGKILDIEAGDRCSFFITSEGVYALGANENGQLGNGTTTSATTPILLEISDVNVIESNGTTLFLMNNGDVYACGANNYGQLGQGYANTRYTTPTKIPGDNYTKISSGGYHNLLFKCNEEYPLEQYYYRNATVYAMGCNDSGQCIKTGVENITYPTSVIEIENTEDTGPFVWDSNHLRPVDATYISQNGSENGVNFYGESSLKVRYTSKESGSSSWGEYSYLKFDISEIPKERITSAKLHFYVENSGDMRESTREIGVFNTCENDWDGQTMTWAEGRMGSGSCLGSFTVTATGYMIKDTGWREIDVTEYLKNNCIEDELALVLKSISTQPYETVITSGVYNDSFTFEDMRENKNIPVLEIACDEEDTTITRENILSLSDTYVYQYQYAVDDGVECIDDEFLYVNYTDNESRKDRWGQDAYISFDTGLNKYERENIQSAKLWVYVDKTSDARNSSREVSITGNYGIKYNPEALTWTGGRPLGTYEVGSFEVTGNGYSVLNPGWKCIDVTEFLTSATDSKVEFIFKMVSTNAHPIKIRSMEYSDESTRPRLVVDYPGENMKSEISFDCKSENEYCVSIDVGEVTDFSNCQFKITYDPTIIKVDDLCAFTNEQNLTCEDVDGTNLRFTEVSDGLIQFEFNKEIDSEQGFSGIVNVIKFIGQSNGECSISISIV